MRLETLLILSLLILLLGCAGGSPPGGNNGNATGGFEAIGGDTMKNQTQGLVVAKGDTVQVDYIGKLQNGTVFDTSIAAEAKKAGLPLRDKYDLLEFTVGAGQMIKGFDAAVVGMKEGEEKNVTLAPSDAYGDWDQSRVISIPVDRIANSANITVGSELRAQNGASGRVTEITNGTAKIDFNPELAGKTLVFTIRMAKISKR